MSDDLQESIAKVEAALQLRQERLKRISEKDAFFSQKFNENMQAFAEFMPHISEAFNGYAPSNQNIFLDELGDLNIDLDANVPLYAENVRKSAAKKIEQSLLSPNKTTLDITRSEGHPSKHVYYNNLIQDFAEQNSAGLTPLQSMSDFAGSVRNNFV